MSQVSIKEELTKIISDLNAFLTIIETFPNWVTNPYIKTLADWLMKGGSFQFSFDVLQLIYSLLPSDINWEEYIIETVSKLYLDGKFIDEMEEVARLAIIAAIEVIIPCNADPIIPDDYIASGNTKPFNGRGIDLPLSTIDPLGFLRKSPTSTFGGLFYFDIPKISGTSSNNKLLLNEIYKSRDFNAFLYYVINRANDFTDTKKITWDDRYSPNEEFIADPVYGDTKKEKNPIAIFSYHDGNNLDEGVINVRFTDNYFQQTEPFESGVKFNKSQLRWNWDYIHSIKLFDTKVLIARLIESINTNLGVGISMDNSIIDTLFMRNLLKSIIQKVVSSETDTVDDCFFSFSNDDYNFLLEKTELIRQGLMENTGNELENILYNIDNISDSANLNKNISSFNDMFTEFSKIYSKNNKTGSVTVSILLSSLLEEIALPWLEALLGPKVMILLSINQIYSLKDRKMPDNIMFEFIKKIINVLVKLLKTIFERIVLTILETIKEEIKQIVTKIIELRLLEQLRDIKMILERLYNLLKKFKPIEIGITDVRYAEIEKQMKEQNNQLSTC